MSCISFPISMSCFPLVIYNDRCFKPYQRQKQTRTKVNSVSLLLNPFSAFFFQKRVIQPIIRSIKQLIGRGKLVM